MGNKATICYHSSKRKTKIPSNNQTDISYGYIGNLSNKNYYQNNESLKSINYPQDLNNISLNNTITSIIPNNRTTNNENICSEQKNINLFQQLNPDNNCQNPGVINQQPLENYNDSLKSNNNPQNSNNNNQNSNETSISNYNQKGIKKYNFNGDKDINLIVHRNDGMNDYVIELNLSRVDKNKVNKQAEFIMILDVSGSMSGHVHKLVSDIIPNALNMLNYDDYHKIYLITFQSTVNSYSKSVKELKNDSSLEGRGGTYMAGVYQSVSSILSSNGIQKNYRILVLSDGIISDQENTVKRAEEIKKYIDNNNYSISVGSIRYNSGYGQPDTRAISSILMLNTDNTKTRVLTEVSSTDPNGEVSRKIYELFKDDYFESDFSIQSDKIKFRVEPWKEGSNTIKLNEGKNIIFADKNPTLEKVGIYEGGKLKYTKDDFHNGYKLNYSNYNALLGAKINMTARKVRINKTSGSRAALEENKKIINYFENFEKNLQGNKNQTAIISKELKRTNELDISKYDNNQLAQFIGVDNNMIPITDFLKDFLKMDEKEENKIQDFVEKVFSDGMKIDFAFDKLFKT